MNTETTVNETIENETIALNVPRFSENEVKCRESERATVQYPCLWTIDYEGVTGEQLQELATRSVVIAYQGKMRAQIKAHLSTPQSWQKRTIRVKDMLEREKKTANPLSRITNALKTMTPEQLDVLRNQLAAMERAHLPEGHLDLDC